VLWELEWNDDQLVCAVYRRDTGLELRVETRTTIITTEPFDMEPKRLARARSLRDSLKRRGWSDRTSGD